MKTPYSLPNKRRDSNLVDSASSHTLVSKIKPCTSKYKRLYTVKLRMAHYISYRLLDGPFATRITVVILEPIRDRNPGLLLQMEPASLLEFYKPIGGNLVPLVSHNNLTDRSLVLRCIIQVSALSGTA